MPALKKLIAVAVVGVAIFATLAQAADRKSAVEQVKFGMYIRMALIMKLLGAEEPRV